MCDDYKIVRQRQRDIRELIDKEYLSIKAIWGKAGWDNSSTFLSHFPADPAKEPAVMSVATLFRLLRTKALPPQLLSMLLPEGHVIVKVEEGIDYDDISTACRDFIDSKEKAHHPDSEAGRDIGPNERSELGAKVVRLRA